MLNRLYLLAVRAECTWTKVGRRKARPEDFRKNSSLQKQPPAESCLLEFGTYQVQLRATSQAAEIEI